MAKLLNIAHRGGAGLWPENTLFAFVNAAEAGFDGAELDVQITRDGKLLAFHDFRLKPELCRMGGEWLHSPQPTLIESDWDTIRTLDVGRVQPGTLYARAHPEQQQRDGEHMPLLSEIIWTVSKAQKNFRLFVEIKTAFEDRTLSGAPDAVAGAVIAEVRAADATDNAVLVGFDWPALIHAHKIAPEVPCWFTTQTHSHLRSRPGTDAPWAGGFDPFKFNGSVPEAIKAAGGQGWMCPRADATRQAVHEAHRLGLKIAVWTVNDPAEMRALKELEVDAIVTDRPDRLAQILE